MKTKRVLAREALSWHWPSSLSLPLYEVVPQEQGA
jgi:hypothetical protein